MKSNFTAYRIPQCHEKNLIYSFLLLNKRMIIVSNIAL